MKEQDFIRLGFIPEAIFQFCKFCVANNISFGEAMQALRDFVAKRE